MILSASSAQSSVVAGVEDYFGFGEDGVVLDFCFADGGAVVGEDDESGISVSEGAESALVAEDVLAGLDDQTQLAVNVLSSSLFHHYLFIIIFNQLMLINTKCEYNTRTNIYMY